MDQQLFNVVNKNCIRHRRICDLVCTYVNCKSKVICEKCVPEHLSVHPKELIYKVQNLHETHGTDKVQKMRQTLGANKLVHETKIKRIYQKIKGILDPLIKRVKQFQQDSLKMIQTEFLQYLARNKAIIENTQVTKSDTESLKMNPQEMIQQTIREAEIISERQSLLKQNQQKYIWYSDAVDQLIDSTITQMRSMISVGLKLLTNFNKIQKSKFTQPGNDNHHDKSFYLRYINSHQVANKGERNNIEMDVIQSRKQIMAKDQEIKRAHQQIKDKVKKIEQLSNRIDGLKQALAQWEQKLEREQRQKRDALGREKKKQEQYLITKGVIDDTRTTISMEKKHIDSKYLSILIDLIPSPFQLDLTRHNLSKQQLNMFLHYSSIQILKINFIPVDTQFLKQALRKYIQIHTLQLNSANIENDFMGDLGKSFPQRLRHLQLIDNGIRDEGLEDMFRNMKSRMLQSLYLSYNQLSSKSIETINKYCFDIKILHISKNPIRSAGVSLIGRYLKEVQQLFIGGTGVQKEGLFSVCRNCKKLKKLNLVAVQLSTDIVSEILLQLQKLEWLDISYSNLNETDLQKIHKLKIFNKNNLELISNI